MRDRVNGVYIFHFKHLAIEKVYWPCAAEEMTTAQKSLQDSNCYSDDNVIRYCTLYLHQLFCLDCFRSGFID